MSERITPEEFRLKRVDGTLQFRTGTWCVEVLTKEDGWGMFAACLTEEDAQRIHRTVQRHAGSQSEQTPERVAALTAENARLLRTHPLAAPWPPRDVVAELVTWTEHLWGCHDCDHEGYETAIAACDTAKKWLLSLKAEQAASPDLDETCAHCWKPKVDSQFSSERFTDVHCEQCGVSGERNNTTGDVFWPAT